MPSSPSTEWRLETGQVVLLFSNVQEITALLDAARQGNQQALGKIFAVLYDDMRRLAHLRLRNHDAPTMLDTTALVHESFLRFLKLERLEVKDRPHFLAYAGRVMRSVVVDFVREGAAERRGGVDAIRVPLDTGIGAGDAAQTSRAADEILRVHDALADLAKLSERLVQVVEMRYFAGLSEQEIADALGITERTVRRDWEKARVLLAQALQ